MSGCNRCSWIRLDIVAQPQRALSRTILPASLLVTCAAHASSAVARSIPLIRQHVASGTTVHADEASSCDMLHASLL
jgi:hypothetical protein